MEIMLNKSQKKQFCKLIDFEYPCPTKEEIEEIKKASEICIIHKEKNILPVNEYYKQKLRGTSPDVYTRLIVLKRIQKVVNNLLPDYGLMIFDAFRTITTQQALFDQVCKAINKQNPEWNEAEVEKEARKYAAHPSDKSHYTIAPHVSGGAIDLAIFEIKSGKMCSFGTDFDAPGESSKTDFFESEYTSNFGFTPSEWHVIRTNRRLLYNLMKDAGFVNYRNEWWHYDLGDCIWSSELNIDWYFDVISEKK